MMPIDGPVATSTTVSVQASSQGPVGAVDQADGAQIVVIGSRIAVPPQAIVVGAEAKAVLPVDTRDMLDRLPGVRAASTAGAGGTSFVSIRGAEPNFAQVTIDGVRVTDPSNSAGGGFDFAQLDPTAIASLALIPGSRTAVYGADALSGVIAIELRGPSGRGSGVEASAGVDTRSAVDGHVALDLGWRGGGIALGGSASDSGDLTPGSSLERRQLLGKLSQQSGAVSASAFVLHARTKREAFPESSGGPFLAVNRARESRDTDLTVVGARLVLDTDGPVVPSVHAGYTRQRTELDTPAIRPGIFAGVPALTSDTLFDRFQLTVDARITPAPAVAIVVGGEYLREHADSSGTIDLGFRLPTRFSLSRDQLSAFAEAGYTPAVGPRVVAALRHDTFERASETTVQATAGWRFSGGIEAYASYAAGFKLPSLFALAFPLTANPNLRPERSRNREVGIAWRTGDTRLVASAFETRYTDLIDFDPVAFTTVNRSRVRIRGITADGETRISRSIRLSGSATWLDIDSAVPLRGRPDRSGYIRADWDITPRWSLGAATRLSAGFLESSVPTGVIRLDSYAVADLFAAWRASDAITVALALRNAGGAHYQEAVGFPAPGRTLRVRLGFDL